MTTYNNSKNLCVLKFCLKVVYPKFNFHIFLVYLAIKYRYLYGKKLATGSIKDSFSIKRCQKSTIQSLTRQNVSEDMSTVLSEKCLIISQNHFIQYSAENFFYRDNGILWISMKLTPEMKRKHKERLKQKNNHPKNCLEKLTCEIHKRLWPECYVDSLNNVRIVPIMGSKLVPDNTVYTSETEFINILSTFNMPVPENIDVSFHPIISYDNAPKIAAMAEVKLIVNEYEISKDFLKEILSNYFEVPKLVSLNDVISIDLTPTIVAEDLYKTLRIVQKVQKIHVICKKLSSDLNNHNTSSNVIEALYIVKGVTQLTLGDTINGLKPKKIYCLYENIKNVTLSGIHICPDGLREKFERLQESITPFLTGDIDKLSSSLTTPIIPILLITGPTGSGKNLLVNLIAKYNGLNCRPMDCNIIQSSSAKGTETKIDAIIQKAKSMAPVIILFENFEAFAVDHENNEDSRILEFFMTAITDLYQNYVPKNPIIFIAVTEKIDLKPNIMRIFLDKINLSKPNATERREILQWFCSVMGTGDGLNEDYGLTDEKFDKPNNILQRVAAKTESFLYGDLDALMHFAMRESFIKQSKNYFHVSQDPNINNIHEEDYDSALETIRRLQSQQLDSPKIPKVYWEDIGGLEMLKKELLKAIEFPIKFPHLFKNSALKRSGILLYGPPGCGKTLVAKAVSTELNVSFMSVKGPELMNMYVGQSEENVREVFKAARAASPCIVFLDELDSLAPARDSTADSGGASDRIVSQLLAELDAVAPEDDSSFVFVMGATNRPDLLEPSLLRPGRLDKCIYVGPYTGLQEKTSVLKALCRNTKVRAEVNLEDVAAALPDRCSGADLMQVVTAARSSAVRALVQKLHTGLIKENELTANAVVLGVSEFLQGVEAFRPSVSEEELRYYESLKNVL